MNIQIALAPALGIKPAEFVAAWNETPEARALAEAKVASPNIRAYDATLMIAVLELLSGVAVGFASNALYDLIKDALKNKGVRKRTQIVEMTQPDGTRLIVVTVDEEE